MGNRSKDENAATSSEARDQESRDATLARIIAKAVAQQTKSIVEASSIYHRHIEHFFHIFGGSTVFSLISESTRRL